MRERFECPANRYVFKSRLNCSGSTAESRRWSGSEFQTLGSATDRKCTSPKGAAANSRNWQLMTSGRSQVLATSNFRDWHTVVGEIPWSSVPKTTIDCHSKLVLHSLRNNQPVDVILHQARQTTHIFPGPSDQTCCSILNQIERTATCLWPSSARKTKQSYRLQYARCDKSNLTNVLTMQTA